MAPGGLVEVRVSWPGHPRYLKKKNSQWVFEIAKMYPNSYYLFVIF